MSMFQLSQVLLILAVLVVGWDWLLQPCQAVQRLRLPGVVDIDRSRRRE